MTDTTTTKTVSELSAHISTICSALTNLENTEAHIIAAKSMTGKIFCSVCYEPTSTDTCSTHPEAKLITRATALLNCRKSLAAVNKDLTEQNTLYALAEAAEAAKSAEKPAKVRKSRKENPDGQIIIKFFNADLTAKDAHAARVQLRKLGLTVNNARKSGSTWIFDQDKPDGAHAPVTEPAADTTPATGTELLHAGI